MALSAEEFFKRPYKTPISQFEREIIFALTQDKEFQFKKGDSYANRQKWGKPNLRKISHELGRPVDTIAYILSPEYYEKKMQRNQIQYEGRVERGYYASYSRKKYLKERERLDNMPFPAPHGRLKEHEKETILALSQLPEYRLQKGLPGVRAQYVGLPNMTKIAKEIGRSRHNVESLMNNYLSGAYVPKTECIKE